MFRTQHSELRNLARSSFAFRELRGPSLLFRSPLSPKFIGVTHLGSAAGDGTCSPIDQSLDLGPSAINNWLYRHDCKRPMNKCVGVMRGSMLRCECDSVNCVHERVVLTCI